ncbi:MICOS complex subunit mic19, partial [Lachnellula suecica]
MGSGSSKPAAAPTSQVWTSETPVRFSNGMVDSLQSSPETDSTRANTLELHIQSRVNSELKRLQERAAADYKELQIKISAQESSDSKKKESKSAGDTLRDLGRESVQNDVKELKKKLEQRKKLADVDDSVEKAKSEVVKCLRDNDRRPLDCWK